MTHTSRQSMTQVCKTYDISRTYVPSYLFHILPVCCSYFELPKDPWALRRAGPGVPGGLVCRAQARLGPQRFFASPKYEISITKVLSMYDVTYFVLMSYLFHTYVILYVRSDSYYFHTFNNYLEKPTVSVDLNSYKGKASFQFSL